MYLRKDMHRFISVCFRFVCLGSARASGIKPFYAGVMDPLRANFDAREIAMLGIPMEGYRNLQPYF